jgi:hypothetical protein
MFVTYLTLILPDKVITRTCNKRKATLIFKLLFHPLISLSPEKFASPRFPTIQVQFHGMVDPVVEPGDRTGKEILAPEWLNPYRIGFNGNSYFIAEISKVYIPLPA